MPAPAHCDCREHREPSKVSDAFDHVVESLIQDGSILLMSQSGEVGTLPYRQWLREKESLAEFSLRTYVTSPDLKVAQEFVLNCRNMPPEFVEYLREGLKKKEFPHGELIVTYADFVKKRGFALSFLTSCTMKDPADVRRFDLGIDLGPDRIEANETTYKDGGKVHLFVLPGGIITFYNEK
jgi:hypothetical protein